MAYAVTSVGLSDSPSNLNRTSVEASVKAPSSMRFCLIVGELKSKQF